MKNRLPADFLWETPSPACRRRGRGTRVARGCRCMISVNRRSFASDWKVATDSYHRYREDFDLMQDLGMNCYRFQIAWSRVCPDGDGEFNEQGIAFTINL